MELEGKEKGIYLAKQPEMQKRKGLPSSIVLICFVLIAIAILFLLIRPFITGYATSKGTFIDVLNIEADKSQEYSWAPENFGTLTSVRISGELIGDGNARVYLKTSEKTLLIYDSEKGKSAASAITGFALAPTDAEQSEADKKVKEEESEKQAPSGQSPAKEEKPSEQVPETPAETPVEPAPSSPEPAETPPAEEQPPVIIPIPIEQPPTETPSNETPPAENITKEKIKKFKEICDETCLLDGLNETEYTLVIEVDDRTKINLQEITYTLKKEEVPIPENLTGEILPVMNITNMTLVENITNITAVNITEVQIENVQEDAEIQAVIDSADFNNESNALSVIFHHESANIEPIRIMSDYSLDYSLSANESSANENVTLTINDWSPSKYFEIKIGQHSQIIGIGDIPEYNVNTEVRNASGDAVNTTIEFEKPVSKEKGELKDGKLKKGKYDIRIIPSEGAVKEILINEINVNDSVNNLINIDTNVSVSGYVNSYAIDPTIMPEFTSANITVVAQGSELYKCKNWNFSQQSCIDGNWIKLMDITPGSEYTFTLTPEDPGYGENATGAPSATLAFMIDSDSAAVDDKRSSSDGTFGEVPIQLNDYGESTEKCGIWECNTWTGGSSDKATYCSGGWNCSRWNGVTCAEYNCLAWTLSGTIESQKYCSGGWNCASWQGNYCSRWNCSIWTDSTNRDDKYCSGLWSCESWTNGICARWNCAAWADALLTKADTYCSGLWNCTAWNGACNSWNCTGYSSSTANYDEYCSGNWHCSEWNGNYCAKWGCTAFSQSATAYYDQYCTKWNCSSWDAGKKVCIDWTCLNQTKGATANIPYYCTASFNCTYWENFSAGTAPVVSLVAPANGYTELNRPIVNFTYNVSDYAVNISNCTFYLWNLDDSALASNQTNTSVTKNVNQTFSYNFTLAGNYQWNVSCTDSLNHMAWSENRNITLDVPGIQAAVAPSFTGTNFTIWDSNVLTWNSGTLVCSGILSDTIGAITNCASGKIVKGRTYRVQFSYNCSSGNTCNLRKPNAADSVNHTGIKGAGTIFGSSPVLGNCSFNDFGSDDQAGTACNVSWSSSGISIKNTGTGNVIVQNTLSEGFMYNITVGNDAATNNTSYLYATPGGHSGQSSKINVSVYAESPKWSNNQTSIVATYSASLSLFNITWTTDTGISKVFFESNYSGVSQNYTMNNITGNSSNGVYNYSIILPAGTFYWRSSANDTANQKNSSDVWYFTISPANSQVNLTLNGTKNNITVQMNTAVNLSCSAITPASGVIQLYKNGTLINSGNSPVSNVTTFASAGNFNITCLYPLTQNYSASSETYYVNVNDTIKPILAVYSPQNRTYNSKTIFVNFSATDNSAVDKLWFSNGTANISYTVPTNANSNEGGNTFTFYANDTSGNVNSTNVTFSVDSIAPSVYIIYPQNTSYNINISELNYSVSGADYCWYSVNNGQNNYSIPCGTNVSGLTSAEGSNIWTAWANDSAGNLNYSSITFFKDTIPPSVSFASPTNKTYTTHTVLVNISSDGGYVWWNNGTANLTYSNAINHYFADGSHTLQAWANDSLNNVNYATITFSVDTTLPSIDIISPLNQTYTTKTILVNISSGGVYTWYNWNGTNATYSAPAYVAFTEGSRALYAYTNNSLGTMNSAYAVFYIDASPPYWTSNKTNADASTKHNDNVYFNVTLHDNLSPGYYIFSYDNGSGFANASAAAWTNNEELAETRAITATRGQTVKWYWTFNDSLGNSNSSSLWQFTVANTVPIASSVDIKPDNPTTTDDLYCNYTYSDADNDAESGTTFKWFKDDVLQGALTTQTISNSYTNDNEEWMCQVTPKDGFNSGIAVNSTTEIIGGSNPSIVTYSANSNSTSPKNVGQPVTFTLDWSDPDQPSENARIYVCNTSAITSAGCSGKTFCNTSNLASDPASCSYTALQSDNTTNIYYVKVCDDSNLCSGDSSGTFEVNHAPAMLTADISPATAYLNDVLTCSGTYSDSDSDSMTISYKWLKNSVWISGQTGSTFDCSALSCAKNDIIKCEQTPADEHGFAGNSLNATRTISNSVPVFSGTIPDQSWYANTNKTDAFNISSYFSDADNDVLTFTSIGTVNISVTINSATNMASFSQPSGFTGTEYVTFVANDSESTANSNNITLTVMAVPAGGHKHEEVPSGGAACTSNWQCSGWNVCINGTQKRTCSDLNSCGTLSGKPAESQSCGAQPAIPTPPSEEYPAEITPEGYVMTEGEGVSAEIPKAMEVSALEKTKVRLKIKNTLNVPLENVDVKVNVPKSDYTPTPMHPYPTLGWSPAIAAVLGGIGIKSEADYSGLSGWKISISHYDKIDAGQEIELPLEFTVPLFKDKNQIVTVEIIKDGKIILTQQVPVEILSSKFFAAVDSKSDKLKDVYVGYDNSNGVERKVTIEFAIIKGSKTLVFDYLGPYTIKANGRLFIAQEYELSKKLASESGLKLSLKMTEKGNTIAETEAAL
jgi:hypothetical protein